MDQNTKRILRMKDLPSKTGFQPSTIYEFISKGKFPAPFKLVPGGRAAGWFETTIDEWLAAQVKQHETINS
jgi:prophage regulatory protein